MKTIVMQAGVEPELWDGLRALADEKRLMILTALREGEQCVCRLTQRLDLGQSLLSHHLRVLREAGLVRDRRDGKWVYYSISPEGLEQVESFLSALRHDAETNLGVIDRCP